MMNTFVCKLFNSDSFHIAGAEVVNLNDNKQYNYTGLFSEVYNQTVGRGT